MPRSRRLLLSLLLPCTGAVGAPALDVLVFPNAGVFDSAKGPGSQLITRLQVASGVQLRQQLLPIARAINRASQQPGACAVAVPRTPERESQYRWAGPWASGSMAVYGRAGETRRVASAADLRGRRIATLRDSAPAAWLKSQALPAQEVKDVDTGLRMLQAGRVDYWLANEIAARFVIRASEGEPPRLLHSFGRIDLFFACHPASDATTVHRLDAAIAQLRRAGELADFGLR